MGGWADEPDTARRDVLTWSGGRSRRPPTIRRCSCWLPGLWKSSWRISARRSRWSTTRFHLMPEQCNGLDVERLLEILRGSTDTAIEHFETSLQLDPRTPLRPFHHTGIGASYFFQAPVRSRRWRCWPGRFGRFRPMSRQHGSLRLVMPIWSGSTIRRDSDGPSARDRLASYAIGGKFFSANPRSASSSCPAFGARRARRFDEDHRLAAILASEG